MNIQVNDLSETRKSLVITLDQGEVAAENQAVVAEFMKQARLPGFRPGKAPAAIISKRFAKEIAEEFKQKVIAKAYRGAAEDKKLDILNIVDVQEGSIAPTESATVTVTVDIRPDFTLPDYSGLKTQIEVTEATDADVENVIQGLRSERADFKVADRAAQKGDYVKLAYEGTLEGKPIAELAADKQIYGKVPQTWEEVEGTQEGVIPGLGLQLAGVKAGDKKTVSISFPAEFAPLPLLAGKTAEYALDIQEVRERVLPPMDEEFFKAQQVTDLEGLKASARTNFKAQKEYQNRAAQRKQVTEALGAMVNFNVPQSLVESETQSVLRQFIEENMRRGVPQEQFEKDKKELFDGARKAAENRVKLQLILAKVAEAEKLQVTEQDIDGFIYREATRSNQKPEKLIKLLTEDRDRLRSVQQSIIFDKSVDFLVSKAKVETIQPTSA